MKEFICKTIITYRWWRVGDNPINPNHLEDLSAHADHKINRDRNEGFTSGELLYELDDVDYRGWWEIDSETVSGSE